MKITKKIVNTVFLDVLEDRMTREAADRWAYALMKESEAGTLSFTPAEEESQIWAGIMYLYGIDMLEAPGEYLHTKEDIRTAMKIKLGKSDSI